MGDLTDCSFLFRPQEDEVSMMRQMLQILKCLIALRAASGFVIAPGAFRGFPLSRLPLDAERTTTVAQQFSYSYVAEKTRQDFPILQKAVGEDKKLVYLDTAATSQKPKQVLQVVNHYYDSQNSNVHRGAHALSRTATEE